MSKTKVNTGNPVNRDTEKVNGDNRNTLTDNSRDASNSNTTDHEGIIEEVDITLFFRRFLVIGAKNLKI